MIPMTAQSALELATQIRLRSAARGRRDLDHLKLQKLCFYAYGVALGMGVAGELGSIEFEAWRHGPVSRAVWDAFKGYGAEPLPLADWAPDYGDRSLQQALDDVIDVYGRMTAWGIRCESHLEEPWIRAARERRSLDPEEIRTHFQRKLARGCITLPVYSSGAQSAALDGIPQARFQTFHELAEALRLRAA